jgi:aspartyl-tRNA(Asn)/glutamyl-tRNA(Gln) amidotransferase subunit C
MPIDRATVEHVAHLARLALSDEERERFADQLGRILEYCAKLNELLLADVPPTSHVIPMTNVLREDAVKPALSREEVLAQAPAHEGGFFRVPRVLETGTDVGDSARIFSTALQSTQGELLTIDLKPPMNDWPKDWPVKNIKFLQGDSRQLRIQQEIDLLFLDAHGTDTNSYEQVKAELANLGVWVRVGGKIVLDDLFHDKFGPGIRQALEEFTQLHQLIWTIYPQSHGLVVIEVTHPLPRATTTPSA